MSETSENLLEFDKVDLCVHDWAAVRYYGSGTSVSDWGCKKCAYKLRARDFRCDIISAEALPPIGKGRWSKYFA